MDLRSPREDSRESATLVLIAEDLSLVGEEMILSPFMYIRSEVLKSNNVFLNPDFRKAKKQKTYTADI